MSDKWDTVRIACETLFSAKKRNLKYLFVQQLIALLRGSSFMQLIVDYGTNQVTV